MLVPSVTSQRDDSHIMLWGFRLCVCGLILSASGRSSFSLPSLVGKQVFSSQSWRCSPAGPASCCANRYLLSPQTVQTLSRRGFICQNKSACHLQARTFCTEGGFSQLSNSLNHSFVSLARVLCAAASNGNLVFSDSHPTAQGA